MREPEPDWDDYIAAENDDEILISPDARLMPAADRRRVMEIVQSMREKRAAAVSHLPEEALRLPDSEFDRFRGRELSDEDLREVGDLLVSQMEEDSKGRGGDPDCRWPLTSLQLTPDQMRRIIEDVEQRAPAMPVIGRKAV